MKSTLLKVIFKQQLDVLHAGKEVMVVFFLLFHNLKTFRRNGGSYDSESTRFATSRSALLWPLYVASCADLFLEYNQLAFIYDRVLNSNILFLFRGNK